MTAKKPNLSVVSGDDSSEEEDIQPTIYPRSDHAVSRSDIDPDALKIMYRLIRHGYKGYLVGGGVRDLLLGKKPKDFDIATDATPRKIKNLFRNCRVIGRRFKLAHVYFRNHKVIEVSTFRDNSQPVEAANEGELDEASTLARDNTYGTPATDAFRRDLTINGLFYDLATFSIIDFIGGMKDLRDKTIRVIGDPKVRYQEDPVRMLRVIRHAARADFSIDPESFAAIQEHHDLITVPSQVRVYEELKKDLCTGASIKTLRLLSSSGLLVHLLPELLLNNGALLEEDSYFSAVLERIDAYSKLQSGDVSVTPILAVIALFLTSYSNDLDSLVEHNSDPEELIDHLKSCFIKLSVPRKERERLDDLLGLWLRLHNTPFERVEKMNLERRRCIEDLHLLLEWLEDTGHDGRLRPTVADAVSKKASGKGGGSQQGSGRRGGQRKGQNQRKKRSSNNRRRKRTDS